MESFKLIIIDDSNVDSEFSKEFFQLVVDNKELKWQFMSSTNGKNYLEKASKSKNEFFLGFQLVSKLFPENSSDLCHSEQILQKIDHLFGSISMANKIKINETLRVKFNLLPREPDNYDKITNVPHVDLKSEHMVFLYYLNDSDGDTVFFEEKYSDSESNKFTEKLRVSPKAGRAVIFDGSIYHASTSPVTSPYRVILNIDFNGTLEDKL